SSRRIGGITTAPEVSARKAFSTQSTASRSSGTRRRRSPSVSMVMSAMALLRDEARGFPTDNPTMQVHIDILAAHQHHGRASKGHLARIECGNAHGGGALEHFTLLEIGGANGGRDISFADQHDLIDKIADHGESMLVGQSDPTPE